MSPWYRLGEPGQDIVFHSCIRGKKGPPASCRAPRFEKDNPKHGEMCGRMSMVLCDGPAGETLGGKPLTCDMPLCKEHRTHVGPDRDLCPRCVAKGVS